MPPGERRPRKSIRPVAVEVPLSEPEEPTVGPGAYRAMVNFDDFAAGELYRLRADGRTLALVQMGYLREEGADGDDQDSG